MEGPVTIFIAIFIIIIIVVASWRRYLRCPKCKRKDALEKTGNVREEGWAWGRFYLSGGSPSTHTEWICKHCKHRVWKVEWDEPDL